MSTNNTDDCCCDSNSCCTHNCVMDDTIAGRCGLVSAYAGVGIVVCVLWPVLEIARYTILLPGIPIYGISSAAEFIFTGSNRVSKCIAWHCLPLTLRCCCCPKIPKYGYCLI